MKPLLTLTSLAAAALLAIAAAPSTFAADAAAAPAPAASAAKATPTSKAAAPAKAASAATASHDPMLDDPKAPAIWDLTQLYADDAAFEASRQKLIAQLPALKALQGTLGQSPAALLHAMDTISAARKEQYRLQAYASLKADEDQRIAANEALRQQSDSVGNQVDQATAWLGAEVSAMGAQKIDADIAAEAGLKKHAYSLHTILRLAPHTLSATDEALLASAADPMGAVSNIYSLLTNADMPWPTITVHGKKVELDQETYVKLRSDPDPKVREQVFHAFWPVFKAYEHTIGATYVAHLKGTVFTARARHWNSSLEMQLGNDGTPEAVYRTLVNEANAGLPVLHRYFALRAKLAGIKNPKYSDLYVELARSSKTYSLAEAEAMTLDATKPLGDDYVAALRQHFGERWMHALPQPGKRGGAYMNPGAYDVHPYVLTSFNHDFESVSTVAHEWGHAMHSVLAIAAQPFETANYGLFVAEIPSTCNEMLLADDVARRAKTKAEKIYALSRELELLRGTFFRQAMFAEFELRAHEAIEKDQPLTGADLTKMYLELLKRYHGDAEGVMKVEDLYGVEWAYIPHFYSDYYVFQYATSVSAAAYFAEAIGKGDTATRDRYLAMLKAGGSDDPYLTVKAAGVDMATPAPYRALVARMSRLLDELEALTKS
jgi:oligoendopeptidase F